MPQHLPLKVLEYFAAGLPVISIKSSLMQGLIYHNDLGALSPSFRAKDIALTILKMLRLTDKEYAGDERALFGDFKHPLRVGKP